MLSNYRRREILVLCSTSKVLKTSAFTDPITVADLVLLLLLWPLFNAIVAFDVIVTFAIFMVLLVVLGGSSRMMGAKLTRNKVLSDKERKHLSYFIN